MSRKGHLDPNGTPQVATADRHTATTVRLSACGVSRQVPSIAFLPDVVVPLPSDRRQRWPSYRAAELQAESSASSR